MNIRLSLCLLLISTLIAPALSVSISQANPSPIEYSSVSYDIRVVVRLKARQVFVYRGETELAKFPIAVGKKGWETPTGDHQVINRDMYPTFKNFKTGVTIEGGARDNPLGARWIGFWSDGKTQIGFHGTDQPELIGSAVSHGCIRMHNRDVIQLYDFVKLGTPVIVQQ
jgi:lipoprotein-anchoring transpeptidase ErfK/SrfK